MALAALAGCSNLTEEGGVAGLEIRVPRPATVEVGQTIQLSARALDRQGDSVAVAVTWLTPDTTVTLTPDGRLTGRTSGSARVQAEVGTIVSDFVTFTVNPRPDTLALTGDSILTVASGVGISAPLFASIRSFAPAEPLSGEVITYTVTAPVFPDATQRTVELPGGVLSLAAIGDAGDPEPGHGSILARQRDRDGLGRHGGRRHRPGLGPALHRPLPIELPWPIPGRSMSSSSPPWTRWQTGRPCSDGRTRDGGRPSAARR
jgi:hypothetical protein